MTLTQRIKMLADAKKTNFAEIERAVGISNGQIRRWDTSSPKLENVKKVADYLNVTLDYLTGADEEKNSTPTETDLSKMIDNAMSFDGEPVTDHDREIIMAFLKGKYGVK